MEVVATRCAGLDVHRSVIVGCALVGAGGGRVGKLAREFVATRAGLERLAGWLRELGITQVGMESTGVYWMPVFAVLEAAGGFELIVVNAQHAKAIKGRKTDIKDAEWLGQLVRHGLVRGSDRPPRDPEEVADDAGELDPGQLQQLDQATSLRSLAFDQGAPVTRQVAQFADRPRRHTISWPRFLRRLPRASLLISAGVCRPSIRARARLTSARSSPYSSAGSKPTRPISPRSTARSPSGWHPLRPRWLS